MPKLQSIFYNSQFSEDAKAIGGGAAAIAAIWLISDDDNLKEVIQVGSELAKASNLQEQYLREISSLNQQIQQKQNEKGKLALTTKCPDCSKTFLVIREHWHTKFNCPHCKMELTLTNPPD